MLPELRDLKQTVNFFHFGHPVYHKLALLENFYLFRMKMCPRTSFEHLFKKDASFFYMFWESFELHKKFIKLLGVKTFDIWSPCICIR